ALAVAFLNFAFNERVVTRANAALDAWDAVDYGPVPDATGVRGNVRFVHGDDIWFVRLVSGEGEQVRLQSVQVYDRQGGTLQRILSAERGRYAPGGGWALEGASLFDLDSGQLRPLGNVRFGASVRPDEFTLASVDPDRESFMELRRSIGELQAADRATEMLEANMWHKLAGPLSTVLMPLLAAVAAFGLARSGQLMLRAVIGMALGFAYFVADNFALAMGNLGAYPPFLAAWGPFLLFLLVGEAVLIRTEE
ncbi:MAG TPA: LptF/LptG family permease, partial [Allosphingosinicella sp.]|nr:LptF/LptG family permease [Allosphingosinicella sp.]